MEESDWLILVISPWTKFVSNRMPDAWYLCYERIRKEEKNRLFMMFSRHRSVPIQKFILLGEALRNGRKNGTEKKTTSKERMQNIRP